MDYNFHTHTARCHHAAGSDEAMVIAAIDMGIKTLGFSDHGPFPYTDFVSPARMTLEEAPGYFESIQALKEKYKGKIDIHLGFEYEYYEEFEDFLRQFKKENSVEYYILGQHYFPSEKNGTSVSAIATKEDLFCYKDCLIMGIKSGLFNCIAHPDVFMLSYKSFDKYAESTAVEICKAAKEYNLPLEYNIYGLRKSHKANRELYPFEAFWHIARDTGNKIILGVDTHSPVHFTDSQYINQAEQNVKRIFGTDNIVFSLNF